ncbi:MAG TPA: IS110 family transposase, partial [Herpetosiphonaceae bacterium]
MPAPARTLWVGIDIAAKTFTATWTPHGPARARTFDQSTSGYAAFINQLGPADPATVLVGMEATGAYW